MPPLCPNNTFRFVLIPANDKEEIQELLADKSGGITADALIAHARKYFNENDAQTTTTTTNAAFATSTGHCDISALTIPTETNGYTAVSLYFNNHNAYDAPPLSSPLPLTNIRATQIVAACGHSTTHNFNIHGDVFIGRAIDNEVLDVWERVDFRASDANPAAEWCRIASRPGGGGGGGSGSGDNSNATSLSSLVNSMSGGNGGGGGEGGGGTRLVHATQPNTTTDNSSSSNDRLFGMNGCSVSASWGTWTQNQEEVELKFVVEGTVSSKHVAIKFGRKHLNVSVSNQILLEGQTFDNVEVDECTYTLQANSKGQRELCITLIKAQEGRTWSWTAQ